MKELTLAQAAKKYNCSTKTLRRRIKAGLLQAHLVPGHKGPEYRVLVGRKQKSDQKSDMNVFTVTGVGEGDYRKLYEELLRRHEQAMMLVGKLQSDLQKKMPQLEAHAASLQEKHDELLRLYTEKDQHLKDKDKQIEMKEFIVNELAKELDRASLELKKRTSPWYGIKRFLGFA